MAFPPRPLWATAIHSIFHTSFPRSSLCPQLSASARRLWRCARLRRVSSRPFGSANPIANFGSDFESDPGPLGAIFLHFFAFLPFARKCGRGTKFFLLHGSIDLDA